MHMVTVLTSVILHSRMAVRLPYTILPDTIAPDDVLDSEGFWILDEPVGNVSTIGDTSLALVVPNHDVDSFAVRMIGPGH